MKICLISLGCDKNLVDSEQMLGIMAERKYSYTDDVEAADIVIINTCCFILDAKEESVETILEIADLKKKGILKALIVTGCLAQKYQEEIKTEIPEVDALLGTSSYDKILEVLDRLPGISVSHLPNKKVQKNAETDLFLDLDRLPALPKHRFHSTGGSYAYLKIAEGCDKHCSYCIIPSLRGSFRSYPIEDLVEQARQLAEDGVRELILVAQETTVYGKDLYGKKALARLLRELVAIKEIFWIRILYCYPEEIDNDLIAVMKEEEKICKYLDIPIQHASDRILRKMGRRTDKAALIRIIHKLRQTMPDITLRTTLITGFPGESEEEHKELLEFVRQMQFERLGVFCYSAEEGTPAAGFEGQIKEGIKEERRNSIMELQQEISKKKLMSKIGMVLDVMIEGKLVEEEVYIGRTYMDIPGVDGCIFVDSEAEYMSGDFIKVKVTAASEYDLFGEAL